jgi:hypothetical protein
VQVVWVVYFRFVNVPPVPLLFLLFILPFHPAIHPYLLHPLAFSPLGHPRPLAPPPYQPTGAAGPISSSASVEAVGRHICLCHVRIQRRLSVHRILLEFSVEISLQIQTRSMDVVRIYRVSTEWKLDRKYSNFLFD